MTRVEALIGSAAFSLLAPGTVAGLIPYFITHWRIPPHAPLTHTITGAMLITAALAALIERFTRFALRGAGTPAPIAPTEHLVVTGLYRFVRNPMYVAVIGLILGEMFLFQHAALLPYAVVMWLAFHIFIVAHEEPTLRHEYPDEYPIFSANVPRWIPRLMPWRG